MPDARSGVEAARQIGDQHDQRQQPKQNQPGGAQPAGGWPSRSPEPGLQADRHQERQIRVQHPDPQGRDDGDQQSRRDGRRGGRRRRGAKRAEEEGDRAVEATAITTETVPPDPSDSVRGSNGKSGLGSSPTSAAASRTIRAPANGRARSTAQSDPRAAWTGLRAEEARPKPAARPTGRAARARGEGDRPTRQQVPGHADVAVRTVLHRPPSLSRG